MGTGAVILLIVAAVVVLAIVALASQRRSVRRTERLREEADSHRSDARLHTTRAEREQAGAEEQAARARRQAAEAEERAQRAQMERERAADLDERAREIDPDIRGRRSTSAPTHGDGRRAHAHLSGTADPAVGTQRRARGVAVGAPLAIGSPTSGTNRTGSRYVRSSVSPRRRSSSSRCSRAVDRVRPAGRRRPAARSSAGGTSCAAAATLIGVEGRLLGKPARAVADHDVHVLDPGGGEVVPRLLRELRLALDAPDVPREVGQDRRVIARAGADVEHLLVAAQLQHLAHARDHHGLRDRLARADRQGGVLPREPGEGRRGRTDAGGRPRRPPAPVRPLCRAGSSLRGSRPRRVTWPWPLSLGRCAHRLRPLALVKTLGQTSRADAASSPTITLDGGRVTGEARTSGDRDRAPAALRPRGRGAPARQLLRQPPDAREDLARPDRPALHTGPGGDPHVPGAQLSGRETLRRKTAEVRENLRLIVNGKRVSLRIGAGRIAFPRGQGGLQTTRVELPLVLPGTRAAGGGARPHVPRARRLDRHRRRARTRHRRTHVRVICRSHQPPATYRGITLQDVTRPARGALRGRARQGHAGRTTRAERAVAAPGAATGRCAGAHERGRPRRPVRGRERRARACSS